MTISTEGTSIDSAYAYALRTEENKRNKNSAIK